MAIKTKRIKRWLNKSPVKADTNHLEVRIGATTRYYYFDLWASLRIYLFGFATGGLVIMWVFGLLQKFFAFQPIG